MAQPKEVAAASAAQLSQMAPVAVPAEVSAEDTVEGSENTTPPIGTGENVGGRLLPALPPQPFQPRQQLQPLQVPREVLFTGFN